MEQSIINFAIYEDGKDLLGIANAQLPELTSLTQSLSGAGVAGNIDAIIKGHYEAMTLTLNFRTMTEGAASLAEPRRHTIELRIAQQSEDPVNGTLEVQAVKHVMVVIPKSSKAGSVAPASPANVSGEYAVRYWATYLDGEKVQEIDPLNFICVINGNDVLADVRQALGK